MFETRSRKLINAIANHPDVRPGLGKGTEGPVDCARLLESPANLFYASEAGVVLFIHKDGAYWLHGGFLRHGRGKAAVAAVMSAIEAFRGRTGCRLLRMSIPLQLRGARLFARLLGFNSTEVDPLQEFFVLEG